jgi:hypothetical protein
MFDQRSLSWMHIFLQERYDLVCDMSGMGDMSDMSDMSGMSDTSGMSDMSDMSDMGDMSDMSDMSPSFVNTLQPSKDRGSVCPRFIHQTLSCYLRPNMRKH